MSALSLSMIEVLAADWRDLRTSHCEKHWRQRQESGPGGLRLQCVLLLWLWVQNIGDIMPHPHGEGKSEGQGGGGGVA